MRLTKRQSVVLASAVVALFFALSIGLTQRMRHEDGPPPAHAPELDPDSKFVLNEFHRSEIRDGKKLWEVKAARAQYYPQNNTARLTGAMLWVYRGDGVFRIDAGQALLHFQGTELGTANLSQGVVLRSADRIRIEGDSAVYKRGENLVLIPGSVRIFGKRLKVTGEGLTADTVTQQVTLARNVSTLIAPHKPEEDVENENRNGIDSADSTRDSPAGLGSG